MANDLIQGKLRFDTSAVDKQLADVTSAINKMKQAAAQAARSSGGSSRGSGSSNADVALLKQVATMAKTAQQSVKELSTEYTKMGQAGVAAAQNIVKQMAAANKSQNKSTVQNAKEEFRRQAQAQREYLTAYKSGNTDGIKYWEEEALRAKNALEAITQNTKRLNLNAETKEKLARIAKDAAAAEDKHRVAAQKVTDTVHKQNEATGEANKQTQQMVSQLERWLATMVVMRGLSSMWNSMTDYAKNYYDAMNEIRIVTNMTEEQADQLGSRYRQMAQEMSVSSKEIASAAVEFWRQGLPEDEVESRLRATTVYAKISAMDFAEAAELMTAATNAMGVEAGHVADVWAYLGDASASGADEIGIAMQRVSAVATSAGISFEQLGAYIATLSEKTRQAPQVIGTALNSIISRLQQVKQNGFKDEDGLGINDIAKALSALKEPIKIMENDEWRAFPDILNDIAAQWQDLTDKEKAYIATTMGGTRQRNYLLTLLDDLSKSAEGNSRAMELYKGALESTGVAMDKYAIYEESVTAAQGRLNAAMEEFYSTLMNGSLLRGWYDGLATIVNIINKATESTGGLNIGIGQLAGVITLGYLAFNKLSVSMGGAATISGVLKYAFTGVTTSATGATVATTALGMALRTALAVTAVGAIITAITLLVQALDKMETRYEKATKKVNELNESFEKNNSIQQSIRGYISNLDDMSNALDHTNEDVEAFNSLHEKIKDAYPDFQSRITTEITDVGELAAAYQLLTEDLQKYAEQKLIAMRTDAISNSDSYKTVLTNGMSQVHSRTGEALWYDPWVHGNIGEEAFIKNIMGTDKSDWSVSHYQSYLDAAQSRMYEITANDPYESTIRPMLNTLIAALRTGMEEAKEEGSSVIRSGLIGMVTGALDPSQFGNNLDLYMGLQESIVDALLGEAMTNPNFDATQRTKELTDDVTLWIEAMRNTVADQVKNLNDNTDTEFITNVLLGNLAAAPVKIPNNLAKQLLGPWYEAIGQNIDAFIGTEEEVVKAKIEDFQQRIADQISYIDEGRMTGRRGMWQGHKGGSFLATLVDEMLLGGASVEQIEETINPFLQYLGGVTDQFKNTVAEVASPEAAEIITNMLDPFYQFEKNMENAQGTLEYLDNLRSQISSIQKDGFSKGVLDTLGELFSAEELQAMFDAATDELGAIDTSEFIEQLRGKLMVTEHAADSNPLLAMLGFGGSFSQDVSDAMAKLAAATDVTELREIWKGLAENVRAAIIEVNGDIVDLVKETEETVGDSADAMDAKLKKLKTDMDLSTGAKNGTYWEDLADILDDVAEGGSKVSEAFADVNDRVNDAAEAIGALEAAQNGDADALAYLADLTGITADMLGNDLTPAEYVVAEATDQASNSLTYLANMLYTASAITIDDSGKIVPLDNIRAAAEAAGLTVAQLSTVIAQMNGASVTWATTANGMQLKASVKPVTWSGAKSSSSRSSGGGRSGGGGGGGSMKVSEGVTNLLEDISAKKALEDYRRELAQLAQSYYKETGQLQGVILYLGIERDIVNENTSKLEEYVAQIESEIEARKAIIASEKAGSTAYKQAMMDLEKLQEDHQKYSKELMKNKTDVEALTKAIKEQNDAIRQMEIDLRNTVLKAIEDREAAEEKMLDGRIAMENEILDLLKSRYEKERDEILETENAKKAALQDEISRIDELLNERKKLAEQEDKMQQIAELEEKIARISADPTRQKEAATMRQQIAKLREDMAWDQAEAEAEAQKKSLEQQVKSLDDYIAYVNDYYEELFKNPQKLMDEMKHILEGTDEEIISWLKQNSEDYQTATESTQKKMVKSWQDTLDQMRDTIRTHWEEVEQIIAGGDENIITFLQTYTEEYRKAGKLQAEAYTDEWKKQLDDLKKAHEEVTGTINTYDYTKIDTSGSGSGGSGGGGGGSSGGSGSGSSSSTGNTTAKAGSHKYGYKNANGKWVEVSGTTDTLAFAAAKAAGIAHYQKSTTINDIQKAVIVGQLQNATKSNLGSYLKKYAAGGMNTTTGLAWLDGTASRPERILSAYQTELFEDLLGTLHMIRKVNINSVTSAPRFRATNQMPNIDTINVTVENLNSDTDYGEAAEKMMEEFYKKLARTRPVGGIQGW